MNGFVFGHGVFAEKDKNGVYSIWKYEDTKELISQSPKRSCLKCGLFPTKKDHDPCIANLKNVDFACCGHGTKFNDDFNLSYLKFSNGKTLRFDSTEKLLEYCKENKLL